MRPDAARSCPSVSLTRFDLTATGHAVGELEPLLLLAGLEVRGRRSRGARGGGGAARRRRAPRASLRAAARCRCRGRPRGPRRPRRGRGRGHRAPELLRDEREQAVEGHGLRQEPERAEALGPVAVGRRGEQPVGRAPASAAAAALGGAQRLEHGEAVALRQEHHVEGKRSGLSERTAASAASPSWTAWTR